MRCVWIRFVTAFDERFDTHLRGGRFKRWQRHLPAARVRGQFLRPVRPSRRAADVDHGRAVGTGAGECSYRLP